MTAALQGRLAFGDGFAALPCTAALPAGVPGAVVPHAIQLDWYLWEVGEAQRTNSSTPHHRTLTVYY
jgi:hypothetical protein